jgi:hypothetical protein
MTYWLVLITLGITTSGFFIEEEKPYASIPSFTNNNTSVEKKLKRDAARLALRTMKQNGATNDMPVEIPTHLVEAFYKILSNLYEEATIARLLEKCNVHTFPDPPIDHLVLIYNYGAAWTKPFSLNKKKTEHEGFEKLIQSHGLTIENHFKWDNSHGAISVRAKNPLNIMALADEFMKIEGIVDVDMSVPRTKGNDILAKKINGGWEITYLVQFGTHSPSGTKQHTWRYQCMDAGEVKFIGEYGDDLPEWMVCVK